MRMRKKKNLDKRLGGASVLLVNEPGAYKGHWQEQTDGRPVSLEIGCGKGRFICEMAKREQESFFIGIERDPNVIVSAAERALGEGIENVRFMNADAKNLGAYFAAGEVARIILNFSDPWPAERHSERRLTSSGFLRSYSFVLCDGGAIHMKTDDAALFDFSVSEFERNGWTLDSVTRNLHANGDYTGVITEYEERFIAEGRRIHSLTAQQPAHNRPKREISFVTVETPRNIEDVTRLARRIWHEHYAPIIGHLQTRYMLDAFQSVNAIAAQLRQGYIYELALVDGEQAGYIAVKPEEDKLFISKVYLDKSCRGMGTGRVIMERALSHANGLKSAYLTVNKNNVSSVAAYKEMGFEVTDETVTDIGGGFVMDDYVMEITLR